METICTNEHLLMFSSPHQALHCKNIQKARELWDSILTKGNAKYANMWLEYYNLERYVKQVKHDKKEVLMRFEPQLVFGVPDFIFFN